MSFSLPEDVASDKVFMASKARLGIHRWDPNYYRHMRAFERRLEDCSYPVEKLRDSIAFIQYGSSDRSTEEPVGLPMLRMSNLQNDSWDLDELKYVELDEADRDKYRLEQGDLLFNRTNSKELVGKCKVFDLPDEYVFASYLIRVRLDRQKLLPRFAEAYLASSLGEQQIDAVSRQIVGMTNINTEEIGDLLIPVPPLDVQRAVVDAWRDAVEHRDDTLDEARRLVESTGDVLLEQLGVETTEQLPRALEDRIFHRPFSQMTGGRYDASSNWKALDLSVGVYPVEHFRTLVEINPSPSFRDVEDKEEVTFIPMEGVSDLYGEVQSAERRPVSEAGGYTTFREGDLLWAKITPSMENGKSAVAAELHNGLGFGSTEFHVFRPRNERPLDVRFLHGLLRLRTVREHARLYFSGAAGHQRVDTAFFEALEIPCPPLDVQRSIADELDAMRRKAKSTTRQARRQLDEAKADIEAMILGTAPDDR